MLNLIFEFKILVIEYATYHKDDEEPVTTTEDNDAAKDDKVKDKKSIKSYYLFYFY